MRIGVVCVVAMAAAACVGDKAELGGVDNRMVVPASARACNLDELTRTQKGKLRFPGEAVLFSQFTDGDFYTNARIRYDITETGLPVNISYAGPEADGRHVTKQKIIRAAADVVKDLRYRWNGEPGFATGCIFTLQYEMSEDTSSG